MTLLAPLILCFRSSFTFHVFHVTVREDSPRFQGTPHQRPFADPWFGLSLIQMQAQSRLVRRPEARAWTRTRTRTRRTSGLEPGAQVARLRPSFGVVD